MTSSVFKMLLRINTGIVIVVMNSLQRTRKLKFAAIFLARVIHLRYVVDRPPFLDVRWMALLC